MSVTRFLIYLLQLWILLIVIHTIYYSFYPPTEYGKQHTGLERVKEALGFTLAIFLMPPLMFLGYLYKQLRNLTL